jgi:hypothetical protein
MFKKCLICGKEFRVYPYEIKSGRAKYCSRKCQSLSLVGKPVWNSGQKINRKTHPNMGHFQKHSLISRKKMSISLLGRIVSFKTRKKISLSKIGKPKSLETKIRMSIARTGKGGARWKGGVTYQRGYKLIHASDHPFNNRNYVFEHRLVMEKKLGRYLGPEAVVHHINGNRSDNRIKNLRLFSNDSEHRKFHLSLRKK